MDPTATATQNANASGNGSISGQANAVTLATGPNSGAPAHSGSGEAGADPATSSAPANATPPTVDPTQVPALATAAASLPTPSTWTVGTNRAASTSEPVVSISGLAVTIAAKARDGENQFSIRLDPPDLGRIDVQLKVDSTGHVTSHLVADRLDTLDLLRRDAPQLERALESAGLKTASGGLEFSLRDQSQSGREQTLGQGTASTTTQIVVPDENLPPVETALRGYGRTSGFGSGVDIRV